MPPGPINYDGRRFRGIENSDTGEVSHRTTFHYRQKDDLVWATYEGGSIRLGTLVATVGEDGSLDMRYNHVSVDGALCTGTCRSQPEVLPDGRVRLYEAWIWTSGREGSGTSVVEEFFADGLRPI